jgi:hypothetical protein
MTRPIKKNGKPFFMYLLDSITTMMGPDMIKGILQRVGEQIATDLISGYGEESLHVNKIEDLLSNDNPLNFLDDTLFIKEEKLFILEKCPFAQVLEDYLNITGKIPDILKEITKIYNEEGLGWAVSPYCIIHQTFRNEIANHILIGGKKVHLYQIGCKSRSGDITWSEENLTISSFNKSLVLTELQKNSCSFIIQIIE